MTQSHNSDQLISQLKRLIEADKHSEIRLNANGGNSILIVCQPQAEAEFVDSLHKNFNADKFSIIDLNKLMMDFVGENKQYVEELFGLLQGSVNQIFKSPAEEDGDDFFKRILQAVSKSYAESKTPVLVNTGILYGAGIDNIQIMEHESVMTAPRPLILLYPATQDGDSINFLGKRPASKYRCMIVS